MSAQTWRQAQPCAASGAVARRWLGAALCAATLCVASAAAAQPTTPAGQPAASPDGGPAPLAPSKDAVAPKRGLPSIPEPTIVWNPDWPKFRTGEYFATGAFAAIAIASLAIPDDDGRWHATNSFDLGVRDALRLSSRDARDIAGDASDLGLTISLNHLMIDALVVAWWGHGRGSVAFQMTLINFETIAFSTAVNSLVKSLTARQRPYFDECSTTTRFADRDECNGTDRYRSFFSGHTSTAFAAAGLTCMHHANLPLYGSTAADAAGCVVALTAASATSALRIMSDNHYASDTLVGAAIGLGSGLGLPWLLHYRGGAEKEATSDDTPSPGGVTFGVVPGYLSGSVVGTF
ncbi:MAG: phosphatase PAP2 family protein [Polyangiaceae bacterium]